MTSRYAWIAMAAASVAIVACNRVAKSGAATKYTCSMHPGYVSDEPGDCPICGMRLTPVVVGAAKPPQGDPVRAAAAADGSGAAAAAPGRERKVLFYRSPMNPADTSPVPKKDAMGMDYVPVYADETTGERGPEGLSTVEIDPERRRLIGLKTVVVRQAEFETTIRTVGRVAFDERKFVKVQPRFDGFVERLYANFTGKYVRKGEPLAAIYSPELVATQNELLLALRARPALTESGLPDAAESARARLRQWGIGEGQIDRMIKQGKPLHALDLVAPISGYVTAKNVVEGAKVGTDQPLFEIADLSRVWVVADVYEYELPRVRLGQAARITLAYWPDRTWSGRVSYVYPTVDEKSRTIKVRIDVENPRAELKPEMFADVVIEGQPRRALVVPDDAVIDSGTRKVVFVSLGEGRLQPREIRTGDRSRGLYEVRGGLAEGESVATGASFLLDSESRLRSALREMTGGAHNGPAGGDGAHNGDAGAGGHGGKGGEGSRP